MSNIPNNISSNTPNNISSNITKIQNIPLIKDKKSTTIVLKAVDLNIIRINGIRINIETNNFPHFS